MPADPSRTGWPMQLDALVQLALEMGASAATVVDAKAIAVEDSLADRCRPPGCPDYGQAASCPPHVEGPKKFRQRLASYRHAILFRIDVLRDVLFGETRTEVFSQLHCMAADIERAAVARGCPAARAYAGGSCKALFCADHAACPVVSATGPCRHPDRARPSMSGLGVDVFRLMDAVGWPRNPPGNGNAPGAGALGSIVGLVLIG